MAGIDDLKTIFVKRGVAQSNRFNVDLSGMSKFPFITSTEIRDLEKLIQKINLPGRQFNTFEWDLYRHTTTFPTGYSHETLAMDFACTADLFPKRVFDDWLNFIIDTEQYRLRYALEYKCDIIISQTNHKDQKTYTMKITDAFPKSSRGMPFSQSADAGISEFSTEFAFNDLIWPDLKKTGY